MDIEDVYPSEEDLIENKGQILCNECNRQFANKGALRMHLVKTHRQLNQSTDITLQNRLNRVSQKKKRFHCPKKECKKVYDSNRSLVQHFQKTHSPKNHECECGSKFSLERDLRYHAKKFCIKSKVEEPKEAKSVKKRTKQMTNNGTQTDNFSIKIMIFQRSKTSQEIQTEDQIDYSNYYPQTSDFANQYGQSSFSENMQQEFNSNVSTYDQSTMYDNFASTSTYMSQTPEMNDASTYATDSQSYFLEQNNYLTQTTQTYFNPECSQWRENLDEYRQTPQTNSSTQTGQLENNWYTKNDMSSMTDQYLR